MSNPLKFYYDLMSQPARALYMFLNLNQIPYQGCKIDIAKGEHLTADYENINPFKRIPCIVDGDFKLSESVAIYRYLAGEYKVEEHWYPTDAKKRARVDEYLEWQHMNARLAFSTYFWRTWLIPNLFGKAVSKAKIVEAKKHMETTLDLLTNVWLKDNQFVAGDEISVADLVAATEVEQLVYAPTEQAPDDVKDAFYEQLAQTLNNVKKSDMLVLLGDLNAQVGSLNVNWENVMGTHGLGTMNDN
ncbi:Glutathione S-transferase theta-1, partial [Pseudolycoriella hygida]